MTRSLVLSTILGRNLSAIDCPHFSIENFWTDSLLADRLSQLLMAEADLSGPPPTEAIYLCGLLLPFGQFLLVDHFPQEMDELLSVAGGDIDKLLLSQRNKLGVDQCQVGALMGRRWRRNYWKGAVEMFAQNFYDLVFMDCQMPKMDGFEATIKIREMETDHRTPIIALTANSLPEDRARSFAAGMDGFLTKPIIRERLKDTLAKWATHH